MTLLGLLVAGGCAAIFFLAYKPPVDAANDYLAALADGRYEDAVALQCSEQQDYTEVLAVLGAADWGGDYFLTGSESTEGNLDVGTVTGSVGRFSTHDITIAYDEAPGGDGICIKDVSVTRSR